MKKALILLLFCHSLLFALSIGEWKNIRFSYRDKYQARAFLRTELQTDEPFWILHDSFGSVNREEMKRSESGSFTWEGKISLIHGETPGCNIGLLSGGDNKPAKLLPVYVAANNAFDRLYFSPFSSDAEDKDLPAQLDIVQDYVAFSDSSLYVGIKTRSSSTFYADATGELMFSYMAILAQSYEDLSDPKATTWIMFVEMPQQHAISGLYRMTGNDPEHLQFIAPLKVEKEGFGYPLLISLKWQQLFSDKDFMAWYKPQKPVFALKTITCLTDSEEARLADESPGGLVYPYKLFFDAGLEPKAEVSKPEFKTTGDDAWFQVLYNDPNGRFIPEVELNYNEDLELAMFPLGSDYSQPVIYRTENLKPRFKGNENLETFFRYTTQKSCDIQDSRISITMDYDPYASLPFDEFNQATGFVGKALKTNNGCLRSFVGSFPQLPVKSLAELESKLPQIMELIKPWLQLEAGVEPIFSRQSKFPDRIIDPGYVYNEDDDQNLQYYVNNYKGCVLDSQLTGNMTFSFDRKTGSIGFGNNYPYLDLESEEPRLSEADVQKIFSIQRVIRDADSPIVILKLVNLLGNFNFNGHNPARFVWEVGDENESALIDDKSGRFIRKSFKRFNKSFPYQLAWKMQEELTGEMRVVSENYFDMQFWEDGRLRKVTLKLPEEIGKLDEPDAEKMRILIQKIKPRLMPVEFTFVFDRDLYDKDKRYISQWRPLRPNFPGFVVAGDRLLISYDARKGTVEIDNTIVDHEIPLGLKPLITKEKAIEKILKTALRTNYSSADYNDCKSLLQLVYRPAIPERLFSHGQEYGILKPAADYRLMWTLLPTAQDEIGIDAITGQLIFCNPEKTE